MSQSSFLCHNGEFLRANEPSVHPDNRAFRFGDALFEHIHAYATEPQFIEYHAERLLSGMQTLAMEIPAFYTASNFKLLINQLLTKNKIFGGALIRLTVIRKAGGFYTPLENRPVFMMESLKLEHNFYELNERGLVIDLCTGFTKQPGPLASVKSASALLYVMAGLQSLEIEVDESILLNPEGRIVETVNSNIFLVSGTSVFTPGVDAGCIPGVMRRVILDIATAEGYRVNDQSNLTPAALEDADEVFMTNAVEGIRWAGAYRHRRYYRKTAQLLVRKLNEVAFPAG
ncbi:MAG TPA: aminotransferase class IV [Bacteroidales bacterium]|nr:aminotransferase class IV [Bacteroidales bacterium]